MIHLDRIRHRADDLTHLSPGSQDRPLRPFTRLLVVHRIDVSEDGQLPAVRAEDVVSFFTKNPEGVATVALPGSYQSKLNTIADWRRSGVPPREASMSFCPYTFLVEPGGRLAQTLPMDAKGAHARGANRSGVGIGLVGDFRHKNQLRTWEIAAGKGGDRVTPEAQKTLRELLRDLLLVYPGAEIRTHDAVMADRGETPKGCPGDYALPDVMAASSWATTAAENVQSR